MRLSSLFNVLAKLTWISIVGAAVFVIYLNFHFSSNDVMHDYGWPSRIGYVVTGEFEWDDRDGITTLIFDAIIGLSIVVASGAIVERFCRWRKRKHLLPFWRRWSPFTMLAILLTSAAFVYINYIWYDEVHPSDDDPYNEYGWPAAALFIDIPSLQANPLKVIRSWNYQAAFQNVAIGLCLIVTTATCVEAFIRWLRTRPKFSLQTAVLVSLLIGASALLWNSRHAWSLRGAPVLCSSQPTIAAAAPIAAVPGANRSISVVNLLTGSPLCNLANVGEYPELELSPDGSRLFAGNGGLNSADGSYWNLSNGKWLRPPGDKDRCVFSPDGTRALLHIGRWSGRAYEQTELIDAITGIAVGSTGDLRGEGGATFSHQGNLLAVAGQDESKVFLFDSRDGTALGTVDYGMKLVSPIYAIVFSPDDRFLVICGRSDYPMYDRTVLIDVFSRKTIARIPSIFGSGAAKNGRTFCLGEQAFDSSGSCILLESEIQSTNTVGLFDLNKNDWRFNAPRSHFSSDDCDARLSPMGKRLAVAHAGRIRVRDAIDGRFLEEIRPSCYCSRFVFLSEDKLAAISEDSNGDKKWRIEVFQRVRPEHWYGFAMVPQFWLVVLLGTALARSVFVGKIRDNMTKTEVKFAPKNST